MRELYLFELGSRTIVGFVDVTEYGGEEGEGTPDIIDIESVNVYFPGVVSNTIVPVPRNVQVPNSPVDLTMNTMIFPHALEEMVLFMNNIMMFGKVPADSFLHEEMDRVVMHFQKPAPPQMVKS